MKTIIVSFVFLFFTITISAQQSSNNTPDSKEQTTIIKKKTDRITSAVNDAQLTVDSENICYSESSKVAFFEALINQNGFDLHLKESNDLAIKNTEEIITKSKDQILYSEED